MDDPDVPVIHTGAWWETPAGKLSPHDLDGTSHFATCPVQERFRRTQPPVSRP